MSKNKLQINHGGSIFALYILNQIAKYADIYPALHAKIYQCHDMYVIHNENGGAINVSLPSNYKEIVPSILIFAQEEFTEGTAIISPDEQFVQGVNEVWMILSKLKPYVAILYAIDQKPTVYFEGETLANRNILPDFEYDFITYDDVAPPNPRSHLHEILTNAVSHLKEQEAEPLAHLLSACQVLNYDVESTDNSQPKMTLTILITAELNDMLEKNMNEEITRILKSFQVTLNSQTIAVQTVPYYHHLT